MTAESAATLREELVKLKRYMNDHKVTSRSRWFEGARTVATGKAQTTIETMLLTSFGSEDEYQSQLREVKDDDDEATWTDFWESVESRLKVIAGLDEGVQNPESLDDLTVRVGEHREGDAMLLGVGGEGVGLVIADGEERDAVALELFCV